MAYITEITKTTVPSATDAYSLMESLRDELQEIVDNAQGTNLSQTQRIQTMEETCSTLDSCCDAPDTPSIVQELPMAYVSFRNKDKRRGVSRAVQRDEAVNVLDGAIDACQEWLDDEANKEHAARGDVEEFISQLDDDKSEWESVEFPGMMG